MPPLSMNCSSSAAEVRLAAPFSHIYVEEDILAHRQTQEILSHFRDACIIPIHHYKDIFNRGRQNAALQRRSPSLILARNTGSLIYPGAPVCQDFGEKHFYYTSLCMNCPFDCDYCFLKGMYPTGNLVLFVNTDDYLKAMDDLCSRHPSYLCLSYDTDLCALESWTGYIHSFHDALMSRENLTVEVRTKAACTDLMADLSPMSRLIFAFTLSPDYVARTWEHRTPGLSARLKAVKTGLDAGHPVRLCFDPMLFFPGWKQHYRDMIETLLSTLGEEGLSRVRDISVGTFRISGTYLKTFRSQYPDNPLVQYPFRLKDGYACYPDELAEEMESYLIRLLSPCVDENRIFRWEAEP